MASRAQSSASDQMISSSDIEGLAGVALAALKADSFGKQSARCSSEVNDLYNALTKSGDTSYHQLLLSQIANGGTTNDLIDFTIPDLARRLGEDWANDKLNFADVTIGTSRLQQTVRRHGARNEVDGLKSPLAERILLVVSESEQHSLGAFIIANQFRRSGVWVQLVLDRKFDQIGTLIEGQNYAMIGLSVGTQRALDQAEKLTKSVRKLDVEAPIVLGGAALDTLHSDTARDFGANFIARNAREALDFCQIDTARTPSLPLDNVRS